MTTVRDIITLGLQLARVVPLGWEPKAKESDAGLTVLQGMYDSMFASGMFGRLTDVYKTANYTAQEGERVITDTATITIPNTIIDGDARSPRDLSALVVVNNAGQQNYVFSGGVWEACHNLTLASTAPLATRGKDGLAALLALYFAEAFGTQLGPLYTRRANEFRGSIAYKLGSTQPTPTSDYY